MAEIEIGAKTDHDLLVIAVTTLNAVNGKLDTFCLRVEDQGHALEILQAEHRMRITQDSCAPPPTSKKKLAASGSIGGIIGAALVVIIDYIRRL